MPIFLLLFAIPLFSSTTNGQYSGYNAAGRNFGWRSGSEHDPLSLPNVYHKPNDYENQPHAYWYENKPFPHGHSNSPGSFNGKLHQHFTPGDEPSSPQNFITDPPGVGLNAPENRDNYRKDCSQSNGGYDTDDNTNCDVRQPTVVHPTTKGPQLPYKSAHSSTEELINENKNGTDVDIPEGHKVVSAHETESVVEEEKKKKPCCACCKDESNTIAKATAVSVKPQLGRYVTPKRGGGGYAVGQKQSQGYLPQSYPSSSSYAQPSPYQSSSYSSFGGGCGSQSSYSSGSGGCCGQQIPSCCAPQLPCCPRIEFPCCPQQQICCQPSTGCGQCRSRVLKQRRAKRFGCIPCAGRRKRDVMEELHVRRKRLMCVPCLNRKKREQPRCIKCSLFTSHLVQRLKRAVPSCAENVSTNKLTWNSVLGRRSRRASADSTEYDSVLECDKSCCDYSKCIRSKPLM